MLFALFVLCPPRIVGERAESGYFHSARRRDAFKIMEEEEEEEKKRKKSSSSDSTDRYIRIRRATVFMVLRTFFLLKVEKKEKKTRELSVDTM